jgi:hypothetical protein
VAFLNGMSRLRSLVISATSAPQDERCTRLPPLLLDNDRRFVAAALSFRLLCSTGCCMSALQIITRGRTAVRSAQAAELLLVACLAAASGGCQWLLDDIDATSDAASSSSRGQDASEEDEEEERALDGGAAGSAKDGGTAADPSDPGEHNPAGRDAAAGSLDAGLGSATDGAAGASDAGGSTGDRDAATHDARTMLDSSDPAPDVAVSCSDLVLWYADDDQDGYGRSSSSRRACPAPAGSWALAPGDCNDDDPRVHPDQREFFGDAYQAANGSDSFDYDCSGAEEGNGMQAAFPGSCGLLINLVCEGGSGYEAKTRPGAQNALCGSRETTTCQPPILLGALVCLMTIETMAEPYVCH